MPDRKAAADVKGSGDANVSAGASAGVPPSAKPSPATPPSPVGPSPSSPVPVPAQGAGGAADSSPAASPAPAVPARRSVVPGVMPDPAGDEELGGEPHEEEVGIRRLLRENDNVNAPVPAPATGAGQQPGESGSASPAAEAAPPGDSTPKPKFKLKDVEFDSEEHAAHAYKTLRGQAVAVSNRARELNDQQQALIAALASAGMTLQDGKVVRAGGSAPPASPGATPSAPPSSGAPAGDTSPADLSTDEGVRTFLDSALNWKQLPQLIKYYEEQHGATLGPAVAMRLVMETVLPKLWANVSSHVGKAVEPVHNIVGSIQASTAVRDLFMGMRDYTYHDGSPAYPELLSEDGVSATYQAWLDLGNRGVPPALLMTPEGVQMAISLIRDLNNIRGRAEGNGNVQPAPPSNPPGANVDAATAAVNSVMRSIEAARGAVNPDLVGDGRPFRPGNEAEGAADRLKRAIRESRGKEIVPGVRYS